MLDQRVKDLYYDIRKLLQLVKATWTYQNLNPQGKETEGSKTFNQQTGSQQNSARPSHRGVLIGIGGQSTTTVAGDSTSATQHKRVPTLTLQSESLFKQAGLSKFNTRNHSRAGSVDFNSIAAPSKLHAQDSIDHGGVSIQVLSQMFRQSAGDDNFMQEYMQVMLDEIEQTDSNMVVFKDMRGTVWQIVRRKDVQNFDEMLTADDAESNDDIFDYQENAGLEIGSHLISKSHGRMPSSSKILPVLNM